MTIEKTINQTLINWTLTWKTLYELLIEAQAKGVSIFETEK
jgi:hypothetical protein